MAKWQIGFEKIDPQNISIHAESEPEAILKALVVWHKKGVPQINYIFNFDEQSGRPIKEEQ